MKNTILAVAVVLAPLAAHATSLHPDTFGSPATITGKVDVQPVYCAVGPCPQRVSIVDAEGNRHPVSGEFRADLEAMKGQIVTVKGMQNASRIRVEEFAPGKSDGFITGEVVDVTDCPPNAMCAPRIAIKKANGEVVEIDDLQMSMKLVQMVGATVTIRGRYDVKELCPMCMGGPMVFVPNKDASLLVRGTLDVLYHIMVALPGHEWPTYGLDLGNGRFLPVFTKKNWSDRVGGTVWLQGKFDGDKFRATKAGKKLVVDGPVFPWNPGPLQGSNVGLNAGTTGGVQAGAPAGGADGAGMARD